MKSTGKIGNLVFAGISTGAAILILATLAAVAAFLLAEAWPAVSDLNARFSVQGSPEPVSILKFTLPQIFGTVLAAAIAMLITVPVSVGIALFISHYAPRGLAQTLGYLVDLLAAIPPVVYSLWGAIWLVPILSPIWAWLGEHMSWFPLFAGEASPTGRVIASASLILAVMILPIITSVSREVFLQTPRLHEEAALALGATRWEVVRMAVLPFGRSGIISASMLGLGRALGETAPLLITVGFIEKMNPNPPHRAHDDPARLRLPAVLPGRPHLPRRGRRVRDEHQRGAGLGGRPRPHHPRHAPQHHRPTHRKAFAPKTR